MGETHPFPNSPPLSIRFENKHFMAFFQWLWWPVGGLHWWWETEKHQNSQKQGTKVQHNWQGLPLLTVSKCDEEGYIMSSFYCCVNIMLSCRVVGNSG